jgi:hypothetical protein
MIALTDQGIRFAEAALRYLAEGREHPLPRNRFFALSNP